MLAAAGELAGVHAVAANATSWSVAPRLGHETYDFLAHDIDAVAGILITPVDDDRAPG